MPRVWEEPRWTGRTSRETDDASRVVEEDTHDELVAAGGLYATMWRAFDLEPEVA